MSTEQDLNTVVYNYLIENGHKDAAAALKKNSTVRHEPPIQEILN
jgi:hypothetical protein